MAQYILIAELDAGAREALACLQACLLWTKSMSRLRPEKKNPKQCA